MQCGQLPSAACAQLSSKWLGHPFHGNEGCPMSCLGGGRSTSSARRRVAAALAAGLPLLVRGMGVR
eukprot:scaffold28631_cov26-Tisochrysis_lutea.AAC.1